MISKHDLEIALQWVSGLTFRADAGGESSGGQNFGGTGIRAPDQHGSNHVLYKAAEMLKKSWLKHAKTPKTKEESLQYTSVNHHET
jgi:hypothetical protein